MSLNNNEDWSRRMSKALCIVPIGQVCPWQVLWLLLSSVIIMLSVKPWMGKPPKSFISNKISPVIVFSQTFLCDSENKTRERERGQKKACLWMWNQYVYPLCVNTYSAWLRMYCPLLEFSGTCLLFQLVWNSLKVGPCLSLYFGFCRFGYRQSSRMEEKQLGT